MESTDNNYNAACHDAMIDDEYDATAHQRSTTSAAGLAVYSSSMIQRVWEVYCTQVYKHQITLHLADDVLTRLFLWTPSSSSSSPHSAQDDKKKSHAWREIVLGLLSVHRMAMDIALLSDNAVVENSFGTTLRPTHPPKIPATTLRIALAVFHNLMPTILEIASTRSSSIPHQRQEAVTAARFWVERIKFGLRLVLLTSYWRQLSNDEPFSTTVLPGLLKDGGMYRIESPSCATIPTAADVQAQQYRRAYVGRRTGRRVVNGTSEVSIGTRQCPRVLWLRLVAAELLRLYRPLYWARVEQQDVAQQSDSKQLWMAWLLTLAMEVTSLQCLSGITSLPSSGREGRTEWNRRRMKLLLFLLRKPAWDRITEPSVVRVAAILRRLPLLGRIVENYLWEWLLFWKHPFISEAE